MLKFFRLECSILDGCTYFSITILISILIFSNTLYPQERDVLSQSEREMYERLKKEYRLNREREVEKQRMEYLYSINELQQTSSQTGPVNEQDSLALVALYHATDGDNWYENFRWLSNQPVGRWSGVTVENNRVTAVNLRSNDLNGSIPRELGNLSKLKELDLSHNNLSGNIPPELSNLDELMVIRLSYNELSGHIPNELGNLNNLTNLSLALNNLSGEIPSEIGNLANLTNLYLGGNNLSGPIPREIGNLSNLLILSLGSNNFTGSIPSEIFGLNKLTILNIGRNPLDSVYFPLEVLNLTNLTDLSLWGINLMGEIPVEIENLKNLTYLKLSDNNLAGNIPPEIGNLANLTRLELDNNNLEGQIPSELGNLDEMSFLWLFDNNLTGEIPTTFRNLKYLRFLWLFHNNLSGPIPSWIGELTELRQLALTGNNFKGIVPKELGNLSELTTLTLSNTELIGALPIELKNLTQMRQFYFENVGVCIPDDLDFDNWLNGINDLRSNGNVCDFNEKMYLFVDHFNEPIINKNFDLYIVTPDNPTSQDLIGNYSTDEYGALNLPRNIIDQGEYLRIKKRVHAEPSVKIDGEVMYYIDIDNMAINNDGSIEFYEVTNDYNQEIVVNHTTIKLNLVISIEWDANDEYYDVFKEELKNLSNYLYDVTDGHLYLNKVHIYDNKEMWDDCDIRIFVDNTVRPNASIDGMYKSGSSAKINHPRRWYGKIEDTIDETSTIFWIFGTLNHNYRTIGHEIGHYFMGFYDEYITNSGEKVGFRVNGYNYGFMNYQYFRGGIFSTEMSSPYRYPSSDYEVTMQWSRRDMDCWSYFKKQFEGEYSGIFCPIVKPTERELDDEYLPGPEYNVSDFLDIIIDNYNSNVIYPLRIRWLTEDGDSVSGANVRLEKSADGNGRTINQGKSASDGNIIVLGGESGDQVIASKWMITGIRPHYFRGKYNIGDHEQPKIVKSEMQDINVQSSLDDIVIIMSPISGEFYFVGYSEYEQSNLLSFNLFAEEALDSKPIIYYSIGDEIVSKELIKSNKYYSSQLDSNIPELGEILLTIDDDDGEPFDIVYEFIVERHPYQVHGPKGNVQVLFDTLNQNIENSIIMNSNFPAPGDDGLELPIRVSEVISVFGYPQTNSLSGDNYIKIGYREVEDIDVEDGGVAVYRWDLEGEYWEHIGGEVNTSRNEVTAELTQYGVYAAFVTDVTSTPQKMNYKPEGFNLYQNYPNPFNPLTKIRFDVPHREQVKVSIYNTLGQQVMRLLESEVEAGVHEITFDASHLPSGVYIYRLQAGEYVESRKMLYLK